MVFGIGNQQVVGQSLGQGCAGSGCHPASGAVSGVYNAHAAPHQGTQMGALPMSWNILQPGLNRPNPAPPQPVMGIAPIGNYMITQSVPTKNAIAYNPPERQPYQKVSVPTVKPPNNGGRPQVGANASVVDMGFFWQICENVNMGIFNTVRCRQEPKFR